MSALELGTTGPASWTPLEALPPAVAKVASAEAPAPLKLMAARGLAPLRPAELVLALYQLCVTGEPPVREAAYKTLRGLPEPVATGALGELAEPRVLDLWSRELGGRTELLALVLRNRATRDETVAALASRSTVEAELELVGRNEERLLRHPPIIAALYMNPRTRMSTAQRALELAVRNGVRVEGIPAFEEAARAILDAGGSTEPAERLDAAFAAVSKELEAPRSEGAEPVSGEGLLEVSADASVEGEGASEAPHEAPMESAAATQEGGAQGAAPPASAEESERAQRIEEMSIPCQIRAATLGNSFVRTVLIRSKNRQVAMACVKSPAARETEVLLWAANRALDEDLIRFIANKRAWTRLYGVKLALVNNPKCPSALSLSFLTHLRMPDLKMLSRSKGVPANIAKAAKEKLQSRGGK
jgi:hypothetical protein